MSTRDQELASKVKSLETKVAEAVASVGPAPVQHIIDKAVKSAKAHTKIVQYVDCGIVNDALEVCFILV